MALFLLLSAAFNAYSQIQIQFNGINEYVFNSKQVLNISAINLNSKPIEVYFAGYIKDGRNGRVLDFKTNVVLLGVGGNVFNTMSLGFAELNYSNFDILEFEEKSGLFPFGRYSICVFSRCLGADCGGLGADAGNMEGMECVNVLVENPTPLMLSYPENESEIEVSRPLFSWIPPSPVAASAGLNYRLRLVEVLEGQNKADALNINRPLIDLSGVERPTLMFPLDVADLEKGKWYAWQVEAFVGNTYVAKSEQWKFKVKKEEEVVDEPIVFELKQELYNEIYLVKGDSLKLKYLEQYHLGKNLDFKFSIIGENGFKIEKNKIDNTILKEGLNEYTIYLRYPGLNLNNGVYLFIIENLKKEKWYFRFKLISSN